MSDNRIIRRGRWIEENDEEASEVITPGELLETGGSNDLQLHSTADGNARKAFALPPIGVEASGKSIDEDYASGDTVRVGVPERGALVYAWLDAGENVAKGAALSSAGNGALKAEAITVDPTATTAESVQADALVAYAAEAVDNSGGTAPVRILVEVA